jgi:hypothetical protein
MLTVDQLLLEQRYMAIEEVIENCDTQEILDIKSTLEEYDEDELTYVLETPSADSSTFVTRTTLHPFKTMQLPLFTLVTRSETGAALDIDGVHARLVVKTAGFGETNLHLCFCHMLTPSQPRIPNTPAAPKVEQMIRPGTRARVLRDSRKPPGGRAIFPHKNKKHPVERRLDAPGKPQH